MATRHVFFRRMQQIFGLSDEDSPVVKTSSKKFTGRDAVQKSISPLGQ